MSGLLSYPALKFISGSQVDNILELSSSDITFFWLFTLFLAFDLDFVLIAIKITKKQTTNRMTVMASWRASSLSSLFNLGLSESKDIV